MNKRKDLSIIKTKDLIIRFKKLEKCLQTGAVLDLKISQPTLNQILKSHNLIAEYEKLNLATYSKRKRNRQCLLRWF